MKFPFFSKKEIKKTSFQDLIETLYLNDIKLLRKKKKNGLDFRVTDSHSGQNIIEYYIYCQKNLDYDHSEILDFFISCGIDINHRENKRGNQFSALQMAVASGNSELVNELLNRGPEIEIKDKFGNTPLMRAVLDFRGENEKKKIIMSLTEKGASLDEKNNYDNSPRDQIISRGKGIDTGSNKPEWDLREILIKGPNLS